MTDVALEYRCPLGARRLFARMIQRGERPSYVHPDNLIEFSCYDCRHRMEQQSGRRVRRVLHRYDLSGSLVETLTVELWSSSGVKGEGQWPTTATGAGTTGRCATACTATGAWNSSTPTGACRLRATASGPRWSSFTPTWTRWEKTVHGAYVPEDVEWSLVDGSRNHHQVWLWRRQPGRSNRTRILLGEVRRYRLEGRATRQWRAFPEGVPEFPPVLENHLAALQYLKDKWESRTVDVETLRPPKPEPEMSGWVKFAGEDPWEDAGLE